MENRAEHLQWCKDRAIEILDNNGNPIEAYTSFISDMSKHPETMNHPAIELGSIMLFSGFNKTINEMKDFINGFN